MRRTRGAWRIGDFVLALTDEDARAEGRNRDELIHLLVGSGFGYLVRDVQGSLL